MKKYKYSLFKNEDVEVMIPKPPLGMIFYLDFKYDEDKYYDKYYTKKEIKRVYSELDPYGEENWEE